MGIAGQAGPLPVQPGPRVDVLGVAAGLESAWALTLPVALSILGLTGLAATHFSRMWHDLRADSLTTIPRATILPTQWGRNDVPLQPMPTGMETPYQKVLLPGEADLLLEGQEHLLRGLVYPLAQVRHLTTPARLHDTLGLGFALNSSQTLAFNRSATTVEVLRFAGLRVHDLITPVAADVSLPPGTIPLPLVRHHLRPWTGRGEPPGSTSTRPIDEHEVLGYATVAIPHLAEIWRIHNDGHEEYVSTYNQRNAQWVGQTTPHHTTAGRRIENGTYATLDNGTAYQTITLNDRHSVLIAYGVSAPDHFEKAHDGTYRLTIPNTTITALTGVTTIGTWHDLPVQLLHRNGDYLKIDYAGDNHHAATAAGFTQLNQGHWQPRWVNHTEVTSIQELERPYPPLQPPKTHTPQQVVTG